MGNAMYVVDQAAIDFETQKKRIFRIIAVLFTVLMVALMLLSTAYADGTTTSIKQGIQQGAKSLFDIIESVTVPIAAVCFAWNGFKVFFGGERGMEQAKKNMLIIIIVLALVLLGPLIVKEASKWFNGGKGTWQQAIENG